MGRWALTTAILFALCSHGQGAPGFDIASVRPHAPDDTRFLVHMPTNGQFSASGVAAKLVMMLAFDVQESQLIGGPDWLATEKWDIDAKRDDQLRHSVEETRGMVQKLLADRFALRIHRETQQRPAYVLTVAKGGPKFQSVREEKSTDVRVTANSVRLEAGGIDRLALVLATSLGRPVVDQTGLNGRYDLSLDWDDAPVAQGGVPGLDTPAPPGNDHGSIFTAVQDQLGLRLEPRRAPVEVIVIDRMERPSAN
jgi:uncharacterized protein (TIGR03435 family)